MAERIPEDPYSELVFGFVYPIGVNADPVITTFKNYLGQYGYEGLVFRVSEQLRTLELGICFDDSTPFGKRDALIRAGNEARNRSNDDRILAVMAVSEISSRRAVDTQGHTQAMLKTAHLVRSLKRPEEVTLLRSIYKSGFYLVGIADDDDAQMDYLTKELGIDDGNTTALIDRDQNEELIHGQRTRDTFYLSDVFIEAREDQYKKQIERFLEAVFGHPYITPSRNEHAMFLAYASAARSAQLGRQVGAAIATPEGDVLAVGMNEVPAPGGGLYWEGDSEDQRDHLKPMDSNAQQRDLIVKSIVDRLNNEIIRSAQLADLLKRVLRESNIETDTVLLTHLVQSAIERHELLIDRGAASKLVQLSDIRQITEYGRAVHGEMDAILTCARLGISVRGKYLYVTTFPCHNCTRHIIASGIRRVYYVEPYPKSKARDLHSDAICFSESEAEQTGKIPFLPFIGIGPRRYLDFFSLDLSGGRIPKRKGLDNKPHVPDRPERPPRVPLNPLSYLEREDKLLDDLREILKQLQGHTANHGATESATVYPSANIEPGMGKD